MLQERDYSMKKIVMTGGGTAGHVTPNIALMPALRNEGFEISYIGSYEGIEKRLIEEGCSLLWHFFWKIKTLL